MKKIVGIFKIGYVTLRHQLPSWALNAIESLDGAGFTLKGVDQQYHWQDYVVKNADGTVSVLTREEVNTIVHNAEVFKGQLNERV